jgi:predicted transcriptional regulator
MKLTAKQNAVIYCLQNGFSLITSDEMKGAIVGSNNYEFRINNGLFWGLLKKGLIAQGTQRQRFNYGLTELGMSIKTRKVNFEQLKD